MITPLVFGQKVLKKSWEASSFIKLELISDKVNQIEIHTGKTNLISLETYVEGEYAENIMVNALEEDKVLKLSASYQPFFVMPNDKLAVHKLMSVVMKLYIPEAYWVFISAQNAVVDCEGSFNELDINLQDGFCYLKAFKGNARLNTKEGEIKVWAKNDVAGMASSQHGNVENELPESGSFQIKAVSVNGDISLLKSTD